MAPSDDGSDDDANGMRYGEESKSNAISTAADLKVSGGGPADKLRMKESIFFSGCLTRKQESKQSQLRMNFANLVMSMCQFWCCCVS